MSEGYYPKYYLKKRQRDNLYRRIWHWIGGVVLAGIAVMVGLVLFNQFSPSARHANNPGEMAQMREDLETSERLEQARSPAPAEANAQQQTVKPKFDGRLNELEYSSSMPALHVSLASSNGTTNRDQHEVAEDGLENQEPAAEDSAAIPVTDKPAQTPEVAEKSPETKPQAAAPEPKKIEASKPEAEKKPDPPAEEKAKPAAEPEPVKESKDPGYAVYAGYFKTRDSAVASKKDLNVLGFPGTIKENGGDYLIQVATVSTLEEATVMQDKLIQGGFGKSFVVRRP